MLPPLIVASTPRKCLSKKAFTRSLQFTAGKSAMLATFDSNERHVYAHLFEQFLQPHCFVFRSQMSFPAADSQDCTMAAAHPGPKQPRTAYAEDAAQDDRITTQPFSSPRALRLCARSNRTRIRCASARHHVARQQNVVCSELGRSCRYSLKFYISGFAVKQ